MICNALNLALHQDTFADMLAGHQREVFIQQITYAAPKTLVMVCYPLSQDIPT
jgi:hypothetical protein